MFASHRSQSNELWHSTSQLDHGLVAVEVGLDDDDLVPRVHQPHDGGEQGLVGAIRDQDLLVDVDGRGALDQLGVQLAQGVDQAGMALKRIVGSFFIQSEAS